MTLLLAAACAPSATAYRDGLESGDCVGIEDTDLRDDCLALVGACTEIDGDQARDECGFVRAEKAGDIALCGGAGRYEQDCRMHLWTRELQAGQAACAIGQSEPGAAARIEALGFEGDDPAPWSAYYRHCLGASRPINRGACNLVPSALAREACLRTGLAMFDDLLNMARDRHDFPCGGGELPATLAYAPDREFDALVERRRAACPR